MKTLLNRLLIIFILAVSHTAFAKIPTVPQTTMIIPAAPALAAKSYILIDYLSDYVIAEQDIDQRVEPASLTKMMTVYVTDHALKEGRIKPTDKVRISEKAWKMKGSRMFVEVNSSVSVEDLLRGVIVQSGNDASLALAEYIAGSEAHFVELMNAYAQQLGMINTHFTNASGWPDSNHYSSARDMAILAKALIRDFPDTYSIYAQKEFTYNDIRQENRNRLLWRDNLVDGIKTGHSDAAGYCLVASGQKENTRLIAVVMGTKDDSARFDETSKLLNYGFRYYETRKLYPAQTSLKRSRIWLGNEKEVSLGLAEDLYVTVNKQQYDRLKATINVGGIIKAPAKPGTALGVLSIELDDQVLVEKPIVALTDVEEGGFFSRLYDRVALGLYKLTNKSARSE